MLMNNNAMMIPKDPIGLYSGVPPKKLLKARG